VDYCASEATEQNCQNANSKNAIVEQEKCGSRRKGPSFQQEVLFFEQEGSVSSQMCHKPPILAAIWSKWLLVSQKLLLLGSWSKPRKCSQDQ